MMKIGQENTPPESSMNPALSYYNSGEISFHKYVFLTYHYLTISDYKFTYHIIIYLKKVLKIHLNDGIPVITNNISW